MAIAGHFGFWLLTNSAAIFTRVMRARFFLNTSKSSNQVPNLTMLSVVTGPPDCTQLYASGKINGHKEGKASPNKPTISSFIAATTVVILLGTHRYTDLLPYLVRVFMHLPVMFLSTDTPFEHRIYVCQCKVFLAMSLLISLECFLHWSFFQDIGLPLLP